MYMCTEMILALERDPEALLGKRYHYVLEADNEKIDVLKERHC